MPNILEAYGLIDASGIGVVTKEVVIKRNTIKEMGFLVDFSGIEGINSYEDLFEDLEVMVVPLSEIADEVLRKIFATFKKKST